MKLLVLLSLAGMALASPLNKTEDARIVGGQLVTPGNCKYQAFLRTSDLLSHVFCGGVITNDRMVLTAAHCVQGVGVGSLSTLLGARYYRVEQIIVHPNYDQSPNDYDIAILVLDRYISMNAQTQMIEMINRPVLHGEEITVSGFGRFSLDNSITSLVLQSVVIPIYSHSACKSYFWSFLTDRMFCAGVPGKGPCQGDSGGPAVITEGGIQKLAGLVSFGNPICSENRPSVFVDILSVRSWIVANIPH